MDEYLVVLFYSNNYAIWTAKVLAAGGIESKVIPVPRALSSDCGYCVRFRACDRDEVIAQVEAQEIEYDRVEPFVA